jgi:UDP-N-acetylmuramoyl-tripeptide--D-alanyl-D-alanine ligase
LLYKPRDVPALLGTPLGREEVRYGVQERAWPILEPLARAYRRTLARKTRVVAVVGSLGKTTTGRAVTAALGRDPESLNEHNYSSFLAAAVMKIRRRDRHRVIEVGLGRKGLMPRYGRMLRPQVVVVTWVGTEHHSTVGGIDAIRAEKAAMVRALPRSGLAVLNGDDVNVRWMASQTHAAVRTFGLGAANDVRATEVAMDWPHGMRFTLHVNGEERAVRIRLLGRHMIYPVLAALAVALAEGANLDHALSAVEALQPTPGRLQILRLSNGAFLVRDDAKSTLETTDAALDVLAEIPAERRIIVLGDVEESPVDRTKLYARLGERVASLATRGVFTHVYDDGPRYAATAQRGRSPGEFDDVRTDVLAAIGLVQADLRRGDVVLVKGAAGQRLDRVALALAGRPVRCALKSCEAKVTRCDECSMLERGWDGVVRWPPSRGGPTMSRGDTRTQPPRNPVP